MSTASLPMTSPPSWRLTSETSAAQAVVAGALAVAGEAEVAAKVAAKAVKAPQLGRLAGGGATRQAARNLSLFFSIPHGASFSSFFVSLPPRQAACLCPTWTTRRPSQPWPKTWPKPGPHEAPGTSTTRLACPWILQQNVLMGKSVILGGALL